ncbi:MAG: hypothetical protein OEV06_08255 [Anaerolineae bacterium]|nr:hypothetical protein [Anaerolineae bacterium]
MRKLIIWSSVIMLNSLACTFTGEPQPAPQGGFTITPNLTLTAVFAGVDDSLAQTAQAATLSAMQPTLAPTFTQGAGTDTADGPTPSFTLAPRSTGEYQDPPANPTTTPHPNGGPQVHSGPKVAARYISPAPVIDGDFSDWEAVLYPISEVVFGPDYYIGAHDVAGTFQIGWDATHLFIGVEVIDNTFVQNASGEWLYLGDSLEILLDADVSGDFLNNSLNADDHQLGFSPGSALTGGLPETYVWFPLTHKGKTAKVDLAVVMTDEGYKMEMAIPWSLFNVTAALDQHFGFAISISDNDAVGKNWQQSMVSNVGTRHLTNPTSWGDLVLAGP